jgi:hypothetical protein
MKKLLTVCYSSFFLLAGLAYAEPVTFQFSGSVTNVQADDVFGIAAGDAIQGTFSFDPSAADLLPDDPTTGVYQFSAPFGMDVVAGGHDFNASGLLSIGILNGSVDLYTVTAVGDSGNLDMQLFLQDSSGAVFTSDRLTSAPPSLDSFDLREFQLIDQLTDGQVQLDGQITSLTDPIAATPEPSQSAVVLAGVIILLALLKRRGLLRITVTRYGGPAAEVRRPGAAALLGRQI